MDNASSDFDEIEVGKNKMFVNASTEDSFGFTETKREV
jgi:hypothetical protein